MQLTHTMEREHQIKRFFKKCKPSWLRAKLLEQPDNTAIEDLCLLARKQLTIHNLCKMDDYTDGAFNEVSSTITENLVSALSKITQTQEAIENKMNSFQQTSFTRAPTQASYQKNPSTEFSGQTPMKVIHPEQSSSHVVFFKCGYPNHIASQCALGRGKRQGGSFPFQKASKNYCSHKFQAGP